MSKMCVSEKLVYWVGKIDQCNVCKGDYHSMMYDASLREFNCWGNVCSGCFARYGRGLGTGLGQRYEQQADGRWLKVEG